MTLPAEPARRLAIVTCMDCRLAVLEAAGLRLGDAHILRNAGGIVTDDVIRSLAISQRRLGTHEVMLIHHTDCGLGKLDEEELRGELREAAGVEPPFEIGTFADVEADVRESMRRASNSPFLPHRNSISGYILDVETGRLREVKP